MKPEIQSWRYKTVVVIKRQQQTTISNKHSGRCGVGCSLPLWIARTKGAFCVWKHLSDYLLLEFGFNLNQGCSGAGTCGNAVPTPLF